MEMYICEKCRETILKESDLVSCPKCGKTYHRWCSLSISNCLCCDSSTMDFSSGINELVKNNATTMDTNEKIESAPYINTETGMFSNIGEKLKNLATVVTIIGIIAGVIVLISMVSMDDDLIFSGLLTGIVIALVSWIGSFALYGFGTLISSSQNTERLLRDVLKEIKK